MFDSVKSSGPVSLFSTWSENTANVPYPGFALAM